MKKMNWKRRMVSAALALSMVASFLPAGLFPTARAITFKTATLNVESDGSFEAVFSSEGSIANDLFESGHYFVLIPDILGPDGTETVSQIFANSRVSEQTHNTLGSFEGLVEEWCKIKITDSDSCCLFLNNGEIPSSTIYNDTSTHTVTIKNTTGSIGKLPSIDTITTKYGEGVKGENGIPYIAVLFTGAQPATVKPSNVDYYAATGLVAEPDYIDIVYNDDAWRQYKKPKPSPCDPYWEVNGTNLGANNTYAEIVIKNLGSAPVNIVDVYFEEESFSELVDPSQENVEVGEDGPWFFTREDWDYVNEPDEPTASDNYGPVEVTDSITLLVDMYAAAEAQLSTTDGTGKGTLVIAYGTASNPTPLRVPFTMKRLTGYKGTGTVELWKDGKSWNDGVGTLPTITLNGPAGGGGIVGSGTDTVTFADLNEGTYNVWVNGTDCGKDITIADGNTAGATARLDYYTYGLSTSDTKAGSVSDTTVVGGSLKPVSFGVHPSGTTIKPTAKANSGYTFDHWEDEDGNTVTAPNSLTKRTVLTAVFTAGTLTWKTTPSATDKKSVVYESNDAKTLSLPWVAQSFDGDTITYTVTRNDMVGTPATTYVTVTGTGASSGVTMNANGTPIPVGKYTITVTAHSQTYGTTITNTLEVTVTPATWPPVNLTKKTDVTTKGGSEGSFQIEDYDKDYDYEFSSDGGSTWGPAPGTWTIGSTGLVTVVKEGTYKARIKADANHNTDSTGRSATIDGPSKGWANVTVNLNGNAWHTVSGAGALPVVTLKKGGSTFTTTTVANSVYSFANLAAGTYTVESGGVDVPGVSVTVAAGETGTATVDYYTVTAAAGTGPKPGSPAVGATNAVTAGSGVTSMNLLKGTTAYVASIANYAAGYGGAGSWTLTKTADSSASSASATGNGAKASFTVPDHAVTATVNYTANTITVKVHKNGPVDTANAKKVSLRLSGASTDIVTATAGTAGVVTFSPVGTGISNDTSAEITYDIYVDGADTGHDIKCSPGGTASKDLYYYEVKYADPETGGRYYTTSGTAIPTPDTKYEVLVGGRTSGTPGTDKNLNFVSPLATVEPVSADYDRNGWEDNKSAGTFAPAAVTSSQTSWTIKDSYKDEGPILLKPKFKSNGKYTGTVIVKHDGALKQNYVVELLKGSTVAYTLHTNASGVATQDGLDGSYTVRVNGGTVDTTTFINAANTLSSSTALTLEYFTVTAAEGTGVDTGTAKVSSTSAGANKAVKLVFQKGQTAYLESTADYAAGYGNDGWWMFTKTGVNPPNNTSDVVATGNGKAASFKVTDHAVTATANYGPNTITVTVYKNGPVEASSARSITLCDSSGNVVTGGAAQTPNAATGVATFTKVASAKADGTAETYKIYVDGVDTNHTVSCRPGYTGRDALRYFDVQYGAPETGGRYYTTSGTAIPTPDTKYEVLVGGRTSGTPGTDKNLNFVSPLATVEPISANYDRNGWEDDKSAGTFAPAAITAPQTSWTIGSYTSEAAGAGPITLTPKFTRNTKYTGTITVKHNTQLKSGYTVTLTPTSGTAIPLTTNSSGVATVDGLSGSYTVTVSNGTDTFVYNGTNTLTSTNNNMLLEFFDVTAATGTGAAAATVAGTSGGTGVAKLAFQKGATAYLSSSAAGGYGGGVTWALTYADGTASGTQTTNTISVSRQVTAEASYKPNIIRVAVYLNGDGSNALAKTVKLQNGTNTPLTGVQDATDSHIWVFTAVPTATGGYKILADAAAGSSSTDTGVTAVNPTAGSTVNRELHFYDVKVGAASPAGTGTGTITNGGESVTGPTGGQIRLLSGGTKKTVTLSGTPTGNYKLSSWAQSPNGGTFAPTSGLATSWTLTSTSTSVKGPITLTPSFTTTGVNTTVTVRVDGAASTTGTGVTEIQLWQSGSVVYPGAVNATTSTASFTNITKGTYDIYVSNGTTAVDSNVDVTFSDTVKAAYVDYYRLKFTTPATQKHYADSWSNTIGADKTVTAKATVFGTADTALSNNDPVLKGTAVAFEVADWAPADYNLTWAVATAGAGRTASYTVNGTMANPVAATLTQNVYPVTGKTDKTTHGGSYDHVTNVKYAVTRTGGDGTTVATLSPSYNTTSGQFTTPATSLAGSAGKLPAGFTYALTAATSDDTKTIIREYKEGTGGTPVAYPGPLSFNVTTAGGATQPEPWIVLEGAVFSFVLSNDYVDKDNYTVATGKDWGSVTFGYPQPALQTVTIVNTGNRPLEHVTVDPMPGSGFVAKDLIPTTIPVGGTATFTVQPVTGLRVNGGTAHTQRYTVKADHAANKTYDARLLVIPAEMDYATVAIDRPVEGNTPATTASITDEYATAGSYSVESITWGVVGGGTMPATFQAGGQYQVTLVLSPDGDHIFVDESKNHPAPNTVAYKVNGAVLNGTGTDSGRLVTRTVNNTTHKVTLVYQFTTLQAGLPAPSMVPLTYSQGKLTQITATSSDEVNFYYVILPDGEAVPTAQAIYDAATDPTNKPIANQVVSDKAPSGASSGGKVTWSAGKVFNGDPGKTYNVYVVAQPKTGGDLSEVNTTSVTLPKKLTITIKKVGSTTTVTGPAYPTVNSTTGANTTGNLTLNSTISATIPALSMRGPYTFTASPDLIAETTAPGYNIPGAWALKQVEVRRGATDAAATAATGTDKDVRNLANIDYGWAAPVTQIDVTFRQRIVNKPIIYGTPTLGSTLTATVGSGASQVTIGDTKVVTFNGTDPNFGSDLLFQWQWNDGGTWRDIEDSTGAKADKYQWKVTPEHSGHSFRVMVTYNREEDRGISGRGSTVASDPTETKNQKLDAPTVHLYRVESSANDATPAGVTLTDKDEGGLYLVVNPVAHEELSGTGTTATYEVTLTGGAIAAAGLKVTINPSAADVQKDASGNYWYRWSANWDNVRPGNSGSTNNTFTASVKAVVPAGTTGWTTSDAGTAQSPAGRRVLKQTDLTGKFDDRVFNGAAQTGLPGDATTIASPTRIPATPPTTGHIHTITDLFQGDKAGAVGAISIQYANNAAGDTKEGNKTNVNMTEAVTTVTPPVQDWEPANKHDYYSYVSVAQGGLYLKLDQFAFGLNGQDGEWKITQAPTQIRDLQSKTTEQNVAVDLTTSNPKVRYQAANSSWVGTYPGQTGDYVTNQFDFTYAVTGWSGGTPVAGTDYDLVGTTFTPKSTGTFTITVTAKYKTGTAPQFKADLAEPPTATFTVGGQMGNFTALQVEATRREATYGDAASAVSNPTTTAVWYVTTDTIGAPDNNQAKYFSLEGIKVTETWSNGNQTYDLSTLKPENITGITGGGVAEKGADGVLRIKFPNANGSQRQVTFKVKNTHPAKNGPGGTGDVTQTSTNTVTLILKARPLPYEIQATNSTKTSDADIDWTVKAEKLWNNNVTLTPGGDKARDGTPLRLRTVVTDPYALKDNVVINANGFKSRNPANTADDSTVGQDRAAVAKNAQPSGTLAGFYRTGTATNDTIDIYPAHINPMEVEIDKPSTITVGDANLKSKVGVRVKQKNDESNQGGGNITFAPGTTITWEKWNSGGDNATYGKWEPDTSPIFQIDTLYRATVVLKADTNHYFHQGENDKFYNVNGFYNGDFSYLDPEWKKEASKVIVDVNEADPLHDKLNVLYNNTVTISLVFDTSETPELHYSDGKGANNDTDYHHSHNKYVTHTEDVTIGDVTSDLVYTINLDAFTRPIFGVTVAVTDNNLTSQPGVTLTPTRPRANPSTSRTEMKLAGYKKDPLKPDDRDYNMDLDRISYTLTIPEELANTKGTYTLTLQARGASSQANVEANRYDVADNRYTFVLVVREQQKDPPPPIISGGGGGGTTVVEMPVVKYLVSDYGYTSDLTAEKLPKKGAKPSFVPKITALPGLKFLGWAETDPAQAKDGKLPKLVDPLTFSIDEDKVFYAVYERLEVSHSHYVIGFPDGTFGPDHHITRGQVATIIARACLEDFIEGGNYGNPGNYTDVEGHWANSAIAYCSMKGVFTGYTDGTFRPDRYISRQELATVVARLAGVQVNEGLPFSDNGEISSWALNGVYTNYVNGWVNGYTDGTFKPLNNITRAETVKIFNGYLNRGVDKEGLSELKEYVHQGVASNNTGNGTDEYMTWPDVAKTHWAYYEIIEAANDHNFRWRDAAKAAPPEEWYEAFIDEVWRYDDNAEDGADDVGRDNTLPTLTVTYVVKSNGVIWESLTEEVTKFASPSVEKLPKAQASEGYRFAGWSETDPDEGEISLIDPTAHPVLEDKTFYAVFEPDVYVMPKITITYVIGDHGSTDMALSEVIDLWQSPTVENLPKVTAHEGWTFKGWSETDPATGEVSLTDPTDHGAPGDSTFYAVYEPVIGPDDPIGPTASPEPQEPPEPVEAPEPSESPEPPETTEPEPSESPEPTEPAEPTASPEPVEPAEPVGPDEPTVSPEPTEPVMPPETMEPEPSESPEPVEYARTRYINGYTDDTFRPDDAFTRAAVATVIANLMGYDPEVTYPDAGFDDLADHWGANAIHFCVEEGLLSGYTDNTFRPDNAISRQEFAIVLTRLAETADVEPEELPFTDGEDIAPWALESVRVAYTKGWIGGYDDGTFLPERNVTRAEAVKMFNAYLGRSADPERIESQSGYTLWADVPTTHWAYYEIIEASNNWVE